jgi:NADP-dependent 3-hydroxy acid dehydrogenase YdfG
MQDYTGKIVAITGAAHGIGAELARRFGAAGADLALADVDGATLATVAGDLADAGVEVSCVALDVRDAVAMDGFAASTFDTYGGVDLFFNNAGVISAGTVWEAPISDFRWTVDVNLFGLLNGIRAFVPRMIAQNTECHIVDTASIAGLLVVENSPAYVASKFGALSLTEVLDLQLQQIGSKVVAHAVCPAVVQTDLDQCNSYRRPDEYDPSDPYYASEDYQKRWAVVKGSLPYGLPVAEAVEIIIAGVEADQFMILTHPVYNPAIGGRVASLLTGAHPALVQR